MSSQYTPPTWAHPPPRSPSPPSSDNPTNNTNPITSSWSIEEIKNGCILTTHPLSTPCITFGRASDTVSIPTSHESCSRLHARIAFDKSGTPWLKDLGSAHGTFVNKRRLPPEACGKGEDCSGTKGSRGVVIYPGDVISFGASTRMYCVEGPVEFERGNVQARMAAAAAAKTSEQPETKMTEEKSKAEDEEGVSWGIDMNDGDDVDTTTNNENSQTTNNNPSVPLDSTQIPTKHLKLYQKLQTKQYKLQNLQLESKRIQNKGLAMELTTGQISQLEKNKVKEEKLMQEVEEMEEELRCKIAGIEGKKDGTKRKREEEYGDDDDDDVDDFYDRTKKQSKQDMVSSPSLKDEKVETQESLTLQWKTLLSTLTSLSSKIANAEIKVQRIQQKIASQKEIGGETEDLFFLQNDLQIAKESLQKLQLKQDSINKEVEKVEKLLKIVNEKLVLDRKMQFVGLESDRPVAGKVVESGGGSMPPPPPPAFVKKMEEKMPPPPPGAALSTKFKNAKNSDFTETTANNSNGDMLPPPLPPQAQKRIIGPSMPPPSTSTQHKTPPSDDVPTNSNKSTMPAPSTTTTIRKHRGPSRSPSSTLGTLAALQNRATMTKSKIEEAKKPTPNTNTNQNNTTPSAPKNFIDMEAAKKDEWRAPKGQDGSGRTKLNDKFAGRY